jgi:hypothetical protein
MIWVKLIIGYCLLVVAFSAWASRVASSGPIEEEE